MTYFLPKQNDINHITVGGQKDIKQHMEASTVKRSSNFPPNRKQLFWHTLRREGVWGHFCNFGSHESTFYRRTAAFYVTKISRCVKKILSFEGQSSDHFPMEIYRRNLVEFHSFLSIFFCLLILGAQKLV